MLRDCLHKLRQSGQRQRGFRFGALLAVPLTWLMIQPLQGDVLVTNRNNTNFGTILRYDEVTGAFKGVYLDEDGGARGGRYNAMVIGPDGHLYISKEIATLAGSGVVQRYELETGAFIDEFVGIGTLTRPTTLRFGPDGDLYVISRVVNGTSNDRIRRYNGVTGAYHGDLVPPAGWELADFVFGPDANIYATNGSGNVFRYNGLTGNLIDLFAGGGGGHFRPLVFGRDENIYVGDAWYGLSRILRFHGMTGALINAFVDYDDDGVWKAPPLDDMTGALNGSPLPYGGEGLWNPTDVVFGPDGHLYVSNDGDNSVRRYDGQTGAYLGAFILPDSGGLTGPGQLIFTSTATRAVEITSVARLHVNGHVLLEGSAAPNRLYAVEASPDLALGQFELVGTVRASGTGTLRFRDATAADLMARFYRFSPAP